MKVNLKDTVSLEIIVTQCTDCGKYITAEKHDNDDENLLYCDACQEINMKGATQIKIEVFGG